MILGVLALLVGTLVLSNLSLGAWHPPLARGRPLRRRAPSEAHGASAGPRAARSPSPSRIAAALATADRRRLRLPGRAPRRARRIPSLVQPLLPEREPLDEDPPTLFDVERVSEHADYELPDRTLLHKSQPNPKADPAAADRIGDALVQTLEHFGIDANLVGRICRPARHALRAAARARHEGLEGRRAEGRPLLRARDDRDPHPRADPRQAGRRRRGPEPEPEPRHARRHLRRPAADARRRSRSGSARTSPATPCGRTSRGCRTSSSPARRAPASPAASTRSSRRSCCARRPTRCG